MLEPRRLAAKTIASRMADMLGEKVRQPELSPPVIPADPKLKLGLEQIRWIQYMDWKAVMGDLNRLYCELRMLSW